MLCTNLTLKFIIINNNIILPISTPFRTKTKIRPERSPRATYIICVCVPCIQDDSINSFQDYSE